MINRETLFDIGRTLLAVVLALLLGFVIILLVSEEPLEAFKLFVTGPLTTPRRIGNWIEAAIPLVFTGLAVSVAFQAGQFNIGAEGQLFFGAVLATIVGLSFQLPMYLHVFVALLGAIIGGALVGAIPAVMKARWGASELVSSLMLNYVFYRLGLYLINYHFRDPAAGAMVSYRILSNSVVTAIHASDPHSLGVVGSNCCGRIYVLIYLPHEVGLRLRMTGLNKNFAAYSGISVTGVIIYSQIISGGIAGLAGAADILGLYRRFQWQMLPGYGFDGIIIATLARNNPIAVPIAALFLAYIRSGASVMSRMTDVSSEMVAIIQGIMILLVTAQAFLSTWHHRAVVKEAQKHGRDA